MEICVKFEDYIIGFERYTNGEISKNTKRVIEKVFGYEVYFAETFNSRSPYVVIGGLNSSGACVTIDTRFNNLILTPKEEEVKNEDI